MADKVFLPRLRAVRLRGITAVFNKDIDRPIRPGINIVLGGNGLGKTTTAQAIAFALTGGLDRDTEPDKAYRWDHRWFTGRVKNEHRTAASVEVEFSLGSEVVTLRRSFDSSRLSAVRVGSQAWIEHPGTADATYSKELSKAGYSSQDDFAFLFLRLLYLSENRRLLAWDANAQARILMLLSPDAVSESDFRDSRTHLVSTDTERRHLHVRIGHLEKELQGLLQQRKGRSKPSGDVPPGSTSTDATDDELAKVTSALTEIPTQTRMLEADLQSLDSAEQARSAEIDALREKIDAAEISVVEAALRKVEPEQSLPLSKLLEIGICPACGTRQPDLQAAAQEHADHDQCVLCGSEEPAKTDSELGALQSQLSEKLKAQRQLDEQRRPLVARLSLVRREESRLLGRASELRRQVEASLPASRTATFALAVRSRRPDELRAVLTSEHRKERQLLAEIEEQQAGVRRTYSKFLRSISDRFETLQDLYSQYATKFLGLPCTLVAHDSAPALNTTARLFMPRQMVPSFNGVVRDTPESCSEAQQFFLDIAFRMAVVELARRLSGTPASLLCETPENALDMSYIDNVANMFADFATHKHSVVLTANIQKDGLARQFMTGWTKNEQDERVLLLLDYGQLSTVQQSKESDLRKYSRGRR